MRLMELLESLGDRLGILETATEKLPRQAAKIQTRSITLAELTSEIRSEEVRALAELPAELSVPFDKIIEAAGVAPAAHAWTIEKLRQLLLTDAFRDLDRGAVQKRILHILAPEKVQIEDLVKDAVSRDQAMDAFERFARTKMEDRMAARERRIAELQEKIQALQKECSKLKEQTKADQEKWREWRRQKRTKERDLSWTVGFLIDRSVITTDDEE